MGYSLPGSCVHGILQASILEGVAISFSSRPSPARDSTGFSCIAGSPVLSHLCVILILGQVVTQRLRQAQQRGPLPVGPTSFALSPWPPPKLRQTRGPGSGVSSPSSQLCLPVDRWKPGGPQFSFGALGKALNLLSCVVKPQISGGIWETWKNVKGKLVPAVTMSWFSPAGRPRIKNWEAKQQKWRHGQRTPHLPLQDLTLCMAVPLVKSGGGMPERGAQRCWPRWRAARKILSCAASPRDRGAAGGRGGTPCFSCCFLISQVIQIKRIVIQI